MRSYGRRAKQLSVFTEIGRVSGTGLLLLQCHSTRPKSRVAGLRPAFDLSGILPKRITAARNLLSPSNRFDGVPLLAVGLVSAFSSGLLHLPPAAQSLVTARCEAAGRRIFPKPASKRFFAALRMTGRGYEIGVFQGVVRLRRRFSAKAAMRESMPGRRTALPASLAVSSIENRGGSEKALFMHRAEMSCWATRSPPE